MKSRPVTLWRRIIASFILFTFLISSGIVPVRYACGQELFQLPRPGTRISLSPAFNPPILKGIKVHSENPFRFDFILDKGDSPSLVQRGGQGELKQEATKLIKYFLASLTIPEKDLWVNLSPYEKDRIIPKAFGVTEMGRDLLAEDYMLKQITASLIYPEGDVGKRFWKRIYEGAAKKFGTTDIPVNTFNKVWIVPEKAVVYENKNSAYVVESRLKVMLEEDYVALQHSRGKDGISLHSVIPAQAGIHNNINSEFGFPIKTFGNDKNINALGSQVVREVVIPILEKEVNEGKNFSKLRQVYHSLILGVWFKDKVKESLFAKAYVDQKKTGGVDIADKAAKEKIWAQYVAAFKKGAYSYIKEDVDPVTRETMPRKYFSGGAGFDRIRKAYSKTPDRARLPDGISDSAMIVESNLALVDMAMSTSPKVLAKAVVRDGVDYHKAISQAIEALPGEHPMPVFTDESDPDVNGRDFSFGGGEDWQGEVGEIVRSKKGSFVFYGHWDAVGRVARAYGNAEEEYRQRKHIKVAINNQGLVGIWGCPRGVDEIIQRVLSAKEITAPILVDISPLAELIDFYQLNYPMSDDILAGFIKGIVGETKEAFLSYEMFQSVLDTWNQRLEEIKRKEVEAREEQDSEYYSFTDDYLSKSYVIAGVLDLIPVEILRDYLRRYFIGHDSGSEGIRMMLRSVLKRGYGPDSKATEMLWDIYFDSRNTQAENTRFSKALIDKIGWERDVALWRIEHTLSDGDPQRAHKAIQILLELDVNKKEQRRLFDILQVAGPYRDVVAAYALAHVKLFGVETKTARHDRSDDVSRVQEDALIGILSDETRNIYHQVMNIHAVLRLGGVGDHDVDKRIFGLTIALDGHGEAPGKKGYTWFTDVRDRIHRSLDKDDFYFVRMILQFWKSLDHEVIIKAQHERYVGVFKFEKDFDREKYSQVLNKALNLLQGREKISGDADPIEGLAQLDEEHVIEAVKEANRGKREYYLNKVEFMIRLYFALSEKFTTNLPRAIKAVKEAGVLNEQRGHGRDDYLAFARPEYKALTKALDGTDEVAILTAIVNLRLAIKDRLIQRTVKLKVERALESRQEWQVDEEDQDKLQDEMSQKMSLAELDHNLHLLGRHYLNSVFNQRVVKMSSFDEVRPNMSVLISIAKFIQAEGLGGVDFDQYLYELQNGALSYSETYDLIRALQGEVLKAVGQINRNIRFVVPSILQGGNYRQLETRWAGLVKEEKIRVKDENGKELARRVMSPASKKDIENALIDELVREAGLDIFKATLTRFEDAIASDVKQKGNQKLPRREPAKPVTIDEQVTRFGQGEGSAVVSGLLDAWGKKGLNLLRMSERGVPVPPGFILASQLGDQPDMLASDAFRLKVAEEIEHLRKSSGGADVLLSFFARSGSAFMLPGLLMTIPNIGMSDSVVEDMARRTGDVWFAYDTYASFIRSFGVHVLGIDESRFARVLDIYTKDKSSGDEMKQVVAGYKEVVSQSGQLIPDDVVGQVVMATKAIYSSWEAPRAKEYRKRHGLSDHWGTSVIVQKAVFGNRSGLKDRKKISGSGSATLMIDPDGKPVLRGEFRPHGQGELIMSEADANVIAMAHGDASLRGKSLEDINPDLYQRLMAQALRLRDIFGYTQLVEFVVENGEVWITQSNDDFDRDDAREFGETDQKPIARGKGLSGGAVRGWVANSIPQAEKLLEKYRKQSQERPQDVKGVDGVILVLDRVSPEMMNRIPKGVHILAKKLSVHAVSLAQGEGVTVVAEVGDDQMMFDDPNKTWILAGKPISDGDVISMDGHRNPIAYPNSGNIYVGAVLLKTAEGLDTHTDRAMRTRQEDKVNLARKGGIDLTRDKMGLKVQGNGEGVHFNFDPAMIQRLQNSAGLTAVIIDIRPMSMTVPMFLGANDGMTHPTSLPKSGSF